ncbi:alpha/beta fold hydrolase [Neobacillus mesonae]|uniref:alpha/beta fold hydrolase n=1 Tax=Neobacillus mesonae TaxID=1193713 RepID=UPI00203E87D8|nr:alpha/beta hydrolase [Neobacillus mesonae]MCM3569662.1 alpha/beta hydrolase [Neobacillus mesonae]
MLRTNLAKEDGKGQIILPSTKTIEFVKKINQSTLIISSDNDFPEYNAIADFLNEKIVDSQKVMVTGTAHMINLEKPLEFNQLIRTYLV